MATENITNAVKAGIALVNAQENASARLWEFGAAIAEAKESCAHGVQRRIAVELARKTGKKSSTMEVEISRALKCWNTYASAKDAAHFTLNEVSGRETNAPKRFSASKKAESIAKGLTSAQIKSLINELKKFA